MIALRCAAIKLGTGVLVRNYAACVQNQVRRAFKNLRRSHIQCAAGLYANHIEKSSATSSWSIWHSTWAAYSSCILASSVWYARLCYSHLAATTTVVVVLGIPLLIILRLDSKSEKSSSSPKLAKVRYKRPQNYLKYYLKITKSLLLFDQKCSLGTNDAKLFWNIIWNKPKKRNEKRGSISYAARTAKYSPITRTALCVPGVYVPLGRVIPQSDNAVAIKQNEKIIKRTSGSLMLVSAIWL